MMRSKNIFLICCMILIINMSINVSAEIYEHRLRPQIFEVTASPYSGETDSVYTMNDSYSTTSYKVNLQQNFELSTMNFTIPDYNSSIDYYFNFRILGSTGWYYQTYNNICGPNDTTYNDLCIYNYTSNQYDVFDKGVQWSLDNPIPSVENRLINTAYINNTGFVSMLGNYIYNNGANDYIDISDIYIAHNSTELSQKVYTFNNSLYTENLDFNVSSSNYTRYLKIFKTATVTYAKMMFDSYSYLTSYTRPFLEIGTQDSSYEWDYNLFTDSNEIASSYVSCYDTSTTQAAPTNFYDNNWSTYSQCRINQDGTKNLELYENYTNYDLDTVDIDYKFSQQQLSNHTVSCLTNSSTWSVIGTTSFYGSPTNKTFNIDINCLDDSIIQIKHYSTYNVSAPDNYFLGYLYEREIRYNNPIFNIDNEVTDQLNVSLNSALNNGNCDCTGCSLEGDYCFIPFTFNSTKDGGLTYKYLEVEYSTASSPNLIYKYPVDYYNSSGIINFTYNYNNQVPLNTTELIIWKDDDPLYYWNSTEKSYLNILNYTSLTDVVITNIYDFSIDGIYYWTTGAFSAYYVPEILNYLAYDEEFDNNTEWNITGTNQTSKELAADGLYNTVTIYDYLEFYTMTENFTKLGGFENYTLNIRAGGRDTTCVLGYAQCYNSSSEWENFAIFDNGGSEEIISNITKVVPTSCIDNNIQLKYITERKCIEPSGSCLIEIDDVCYKYSSCSSYSCGAGGGAKNEMYESSLIPSVPQIEKSFNISELRTFTIDGTYPLISFINGTDEGNYTSKSELTLNISLIELNLKNITYNLYNSTHYLIDNDTFTTNITENTFDIPGPDTYYYNVTVCDIADNCNSTTTKNATLGGPFITIITPADGATYNTQAVTLNFTVTENITDCYYNLSSGALSSTDNEIINCSPVVLNFPADGIYTIDMWIIDNLNISGYRSTTFTIDAVTDGGGGGDTVTILIGDNITGWTLTTQAGGEAYTLIMTQGDTRSKSLIFRNIGESERNINIKCESEFENFCDYVTFTDTDIILPVLKEVDTEIEFTIALPDELELGNYAFNIIATDDFDRTVSMTVHVNVGTSGVIVNLGSKFLTSYSIAEVEVPYIIILLILWPLISIIGFYTVIRKRNIPGDKIWAMFGGLIISILIVVIS